MIDKSSPSPRLLNELCGRTERNNWCAPFYIRQYQIAGDTKVFVSAGWRLFPIVLLWLMQKRMDSPTSAQGTTKTAAIWAVSDPVFVFHCPDWGCGDLPRSGHFLVSAIGSTMASARQLFRLLSPHGPRSVRPAE